MPTSDAVLVDTAAGTCRLMGFSIADTGGAAVLVYIREGSASGAILAAIELLANTSVTKWFGPQGILCNGDLWFDKSSGTYSGVVYYE